MSTIPAVSLGPVSSRKRGKNQLLCFVWAFLFVTGFARAGTISGTVNGPDGAPFKGAFVEAQNVKTKITFIVLSDPQGRYQIENLLAGQYAVNIHAVGFKADAHTGVDPDAQQTAPLDFSLQKAAVLWSDLSLYQGEILLPDLPGKTILMTPLVRNMNGLGSSATWRDSTCQVCHAFQNKMAPWVRDEEGWRTRVEYMRNGLGAGSKMSPQEEDVLVSYMASLFGPKSILPQSPADDPKYKDTVHSFTDESLNIEYVEYDLPKPQRMPWSAVPDGKGSVWMPYKSSASAIARLDPVTGDVREFRVPNKGFTQIHSAFPAPDGSVWLAENGAPKKLGRWDPKTQEITEYPDTVGKHTVRVASNGLVCSSGTISLFDPKTKEYTHFDKQPGAYGVVFDRENNCWFTQYDKGGMIGKIDTKTDQLKMWATPTLKNGNDVYSRRIQIDPSGNVWFDESESGQIGRFDPKTETFKEYPLPGPMATPYAMNLDREGQVWYASEYMDVFGRMDPKTGKTVEYPFPHSENTSREFFLDAQGNMWYATPSNNKVGYFFLRPKTTAQK